MSKKRRKYTREFKISVITELDSGKTSQEFKGIQSPSFHDYQVEEGIQQGSGICIQMGLQARKVE